MTDQMTGPITPPITAAPRISFEEFVERYGDKRYEYVDGRPLPMGPEIVGEDGETTVPPPKLIHGLMTGQIADILNQFLRGKGLGVVLGAETGFLMQQEPRELRAADVAFVSLARLKTVANVNDWLPFPPDLAVEVISEWDRAADVRRKVRSYLTHGTRLLWVIYPEDREIDVFRPDQERQTLSVGDTLDGGEVLPGFAVPVADLFAVLEKLKEDRT